MPPQLALFLCIIFIAYLFKRDSKQEYQPSRAVWIPTIWLLILGSRSVSQWLDIRTNRSVQDQLMEGSPLDAMVYALLIIGAFAVLRKRQVRLGDVIRNNPWLLLFFLYAGISAIWSDFPFVSFKRWIKGLGDPMMALVLLSDANPAKAIETVIKRCTYVLIPLSVVFIKYFP